jgi:hypothetical protein
VAVSVGTGVAVSVGMGVVVSVDTGVAVSVGMGVSEAVAVGVGVVVAVAVVVGVGVKVCVAVDVGEGTVAVGVFVGFGVGVGKIVGGTSPGGVPYPGCRNRSLISSTWALNLIYGAIIFTSGVINGWLKTTSTATRAFGPPGNSVPNIGGLEA